MHTTKMLLLAIALAFIVALTAPAWAFNGQTQGYHDTMMGWWGPFSWTMGLWMIVMVAIVIAIVVSIVLMVRWIAQQRPYGSHDMKESPLEILKRRYARGEITKAEFEELKKDIM